MKKKIEHLMLIAVFMLLSVSAFSQQKRQPSWLSKDGYWVVESNVHKPLQHTVRFYNNDNELIGSKQLDGMKLNIKKRKVKMMLKTDLKSSLLAWEQTRKSDQPALTRAEF
jgi:hypothetical protein